MVISRGDAPVWVVKTWGTQETRSREISGRQGALHYGGSEISLLRSAFAQMTGEGKRSCHLSPFEMDVCCRRYRHLERRDAPVWVVKALGTHETRSREISCRQGSLHYGGARFHCSAPLSSK